MIELRNISKAFGSRIVLNDFSVVINDGDYICFYGQSGCGKTTLLNIIGLIEDHDSGLVLYDAKPITKRYRRKLLDENISFIFQNFGLIDDLSVYENFDVIRSIKNVNKSKKHDLIDKTLEKVGLANIGNKMIYELSGGEQQRVAIAKAIIKNSSIILADEPTASLDPDNQQVILDVLKDLNDKGCTIIVVSHDDICINASERKVKIERN